MSHTVDTWLAGILFWGSIFSVIYFEAYRVEIIAWLRKWLDD